MGSDGPDNIERRVPIRRTSRDLPRCAPSPSWPRGGNCCPDPATANCTIAPLLRVRASLPSEIRPSSQLFLQLAEDFLGGNTWLRAIVQIFGTPLRDFNPLLRGIG